MIQLVDFLSFLTPYPELTHFFLKLILYLSPFPVHQGISEASFTVTYSLHAAVVTRFSAVSTLNSSLSIPLLFFVYF